MWPRFRKRGNKAGACRPEGPDEASMWPRFRKRGNTGARDCGGSWLGSGFNVAALSKARKSTPGRSTVAPGTSFNVAALSKARKSAASRVASGSSITLQCGRAFESAEITPGMWTWRLVTSFNVAALSKARKYQAGLRPKSPEDASMWPRFRKRGNYARDVDLAPRDELQCGRAFESAEMGQP